MYKSKTVFILGAGSSHELGLPLGEELMQKVFSLINIKYEMGTKLVAGDSRIEAALRAHLEKKNFYYENEYNSYLRSVWALAEALPLHRSVDDLLYTFADDVRAQFIGKLGIAMAILDAEKESALKTDSGHPKVEFSNLQETWITKFFRELIANIKREQIAEAFENVGFINFNYDRSLEHSLYYALQQGLELGENRAKEIINDINIVRPYGRIGSLPWQASSSEKAVAYGGNFEDIIDHANQIKTFHETIEEDVLGHKLSLMLSKAKKIIYLGCAFHEQNQKFICSHPMPYLKSIYATGYGLSHATCNNIKDELTSRMDKLTNTSFSVEIAQDMRCSNFFNDFARSLCS